MVLTGASLEVTVGSLPQDGTLGFSSGTFGLSWARTLTARTRIDRALGGVLGVCIKNGV